MHTDRWWDQFDARVLEGRMECSAVKVVFWALVTSVSVLNLMRTATASQWKECSKGGVLENWNRKV